MAMAEQKKKETRPTKPNEGDEGGGANPEVAKKGRRSRRIWTTSWMKLTISSRRTPRNS
jgi:hypothetical protein